MALKKVFKLSCVTAAALSGSYLNLENSKAEPTVNTRIVKFPPKARSDLVKSLQDSQEFDILIIGGGSTGCGIALDASTRGLKTALVEKDDFGSGSSSRGTKLVHYGPPTLSKQILIERSNILCNAPHLIHPLPILVPIYKWWDLPIFWLKLKAYDFVAGKHCIRSSYYMSSDKILELFPLLKQNGLVGGLVYYNAILNDARMNLALALTAIKHGATVVNHVKAVELLKENDQLGVEKVFGAKVKDILTGNVWNIRAKCVINTTGILTDSFVNLDDCPKYFAYSGVHVVLPGNFLPTSMGFMDPNGENLFFLPWQKHTLIGSILKSSEIQHPLPKSEDIENLLEKFNQFLSSGAEVKSNDVLSSWCGVFTSAADLSKLEIDGLDQTHEICLTSSGLISTIGGTWTTYRLMAEKVVDVAIEKFNLNSKNGCLTPKIILEGGANWSPNLVIRLVQDFGIEEGISEHLVQNFGDFAFEVAKLAKLTGKRWPILGAELHKNLPYIQAEVKFACTHEYACTVVDVIARRLQIASLNCRAAEEILPEVIKIMAKKLNWSKDGEKKQYAEAMDFLINEMGLKLNKELRFHMLVKLTSEELHKHVKMFKSLDKNCKGFVKLELVKKAMNSDQGKDGDRKFEIVLKQIGYQNPENEVDLAEYLQIVYFLGRGSIRQVMEENYEEHGGKIKTPRDFD